MRRADLQSIAQDKADDAALLLRRGRPTNAYYLAGYAIEIGLKACIARQIFSETIPALNFVRSIHDHDLARLVRVAGLDARLKDRQAIDPEFAAAWATVCEWGPEARYDMIELRSAQLMVTAVSDADKGIFPWIKAYW